MNKQIEILLTETIVLTLDKLKAMEPNKIFASGYGMIKHPWFNHATKNVDKNGMTKVRWVAVRGGIYDWAIYHSLDGNFISEDYLDDDKHLKLPEFMIYKHGAKLTREDKIKEFVPCTDEAFEMYRY